MLIEVGVFELGLDKNALMSLTDNEFTSMITDLTLRNLKGYCNNAQFTGQHVIERNETDWSGMPAFRINAKGFSAAANQSVMIDMIIGIDTVRCIYYLFASQVVMSKYDNIHDEIAASIESFKKI